LEKDSNDIALFRRVRKDDRLALNTLFANYYQKLCTFASTYLNSEEESEEVVADVFISLWKNREHLEIKNNFRAYIYIAVKHACLALIKKRRPHHEAITDSMENTFADQQTPEQVLQLHELMDEINHTVESLPLRCRQIFIMSRYDGLKYKEIAEILSIAEKTVENQLVKALEILRLAVQAKQHST
jgi:RNA polymerase sigma-70 factor, ECF subfamily